MSDHPVAEKEAGPPAADTPSNGATQPEKKKREYKDFGHETEKPTRTLLSPPLFAPTSLRSATLPRYHLPEPRANPPPLPTLLSDRISFHFTFCGR